MNHFFERAISIAALACGTWCAAACGGSFQGGDGDGDAGSGGSGASAGSTGKGGHAGSAGSAVGGSTPSAGTGSGGSSGGACEYNGQIYQEGDSFPAGDGCNNCSCGADGSVGCTEIGCDQCSNLQEVYSAAIEEARVCDPMAPDPCSELIFVGLQCGCESFLNPEHADAIGRAAVAQEEFAMLSCGGDVLCGACQAPTGAYCSVDGVCVDVFDNNGGGVSCKVGDQVYPSGSSGVPDPYSCNTCDCVDGELTACTEINCPVACPPDTIPATQCAECGPVDNCLSVEQGCLPSCTDTCEIGACIDNVCRMVCG